MKNVDKQQVQEFAEVDKELEEILKKEFLGKKISKIMLVQPPDSDSKNFKFGAAKRGRLWNYPPYGLGLLATGLRKKGTVVSITNLNHEILKNINELKLEKEEFDFTKLWQEKLRKDIKEFKPDFIGLTSMFSQSHDMVKEISELIKKENKDILIGLGGVHVTNSLVDGKTFEKFTKSTSVVDFYFLYEADLSFLTFVEIFNEKKNYNKLSQMIIKLDQNSYVQIKKRLHPTGDELNNLPAHDLMETSELSKHGTIGSFFCLTPKNTKLSTVLSNRGCRAQCTFCSVRNFNGVGVRRRTVSSVVEELKILHNEYGINHIMWLDDDFLYNPTESIHLFNEITKAKLNMTWDCSNGVIAAACKDEVIAAAAESGCIGVNIGMESGNKDILKSVHKPGAPKNFLQAAEVFKKYPSINARVFLMIGFPNESYQQILDTINLSKEMNLDWYNVSILEPLPNTPIFETMVADGEIDLENLEFSNIRYNSGGLGKQTQKSRDMLASDFNEAFRVKDLTEVPPKMKLDDIWAYMNFHLNFNRLKEESSMQKIIQKKLYVENITDLISPDNCLALYFLCYLEKKINKSINFNTVEKLKRTLRAHPYWQDRFSEFNLSANDFDLGHVGQYQKAN